MNKVKLVSITPDAEETIAYIARVSNPKNQENEKYEGLLKYMIKHGHWSPFEQAYMTIEIQTSLAIATQILRHRSFTYQQFSQRYAEKNLINESIDLPELRRQDTKNRQNSIDDISEDIKNSLIKINNNDINPLNLFRVHWFNKKDQTDFVDEPEKILLFVANWACISSPIICLLYTSPSPRDRG